MDSVDWWILFGLGLLQIGCICVLAFSITQMAYAMQVLGVAMKQLAELTKDEMEMRYGHSGLYEERDAEGREGRQADGDRGIRG